MAKIRMESAAIVSSSTDNTARIGLSTHRSNGLYHCLSAQSQRKFFSLFLRNSGKNYIFSSVRIC